MLIIHISSFAVVCSTEESLSGCWVLCRSQTNLYLLEFHICLQMPAVAIGPRITSYPPVQDRAMPDRYSSGPDYSQPMVLLYIIYICYVYR